MKKNLLFSVALAVSSTMGAQELVTTETTVVPAEISADGKIIDDEIDETGKRNPIHLNGIWDNWFAGVGIGSTTYYGNFCHASSTLERTSITANAHVGKWFTPAVGLRASLSLYRPKSFDENPNNPYVVGQADNGLYKTRWTMVTATADMMLNVTNLFWGYRTDRLYNCIPYVGGGWLHTAFNDVVVTAGILNRFYITDAWALNLELRAAIFPEHIDYTAQTEIEGRWDQSMLTALNVGVSYRFGDRHWKTCSAYTADVKTLQKRLNALQQENADLKASLQKQPERVEVIKKDMQVSDLGIFFELNKSELSDKERVNLGFYAEMIKKAPGKKFKIVGYADKYTGNDSINTPLSRARAEKVYNVLVEEFGISKEQLTIDYRGGVDNMFYDTPYLSRVTIIKMED